MPGQQPRSGSWMWQAFTGVLLVILLSLHMIANHFVVEGGLRTFQDVLKYISNPIIMLLEVLFLISVTYHAMLGVRAILFDLDLSPIARRTITRVLTVVGGAMLVWGLYLTFYLYRLAA